MALAILLARDFLIRGIVPLLFVAFLLPGLAYGIAAKAIRSDKDVARMMGQAMAGMGTYVALAFVAAQFLAWFNWSNLGLILAVKGAAACFSGRRWNRCWASKSFSGWRSGAVAGKCADGRREAALATGHRILGERLQARMGAAAVGAGPGHRFNRRRASNDSASTMATSNNIASSTVQASCIWNRPRW